MEPQADPDILLQKKRKLTNVAIGLIFLLSGIEYAVILPTVWLYLQSFDAQPFFLGLVLSAFSLTELLSGPMFGYWSDSTGKTKNVILLSNCFEIADLYRTESKVSEQEMEGYLNRIKFPRLSEEQRSPLDAPVSVNELQRALESINGNFMYFVGISKWFLLGSRLVAGVGAGAGASIFGYLTRCSSSRDRIPVFAMAMACRQAGLLIGPAFNVFLRYCTFQMGPFHVDKFSAPGIFMCALWALMQLVVVFMFYDLPPNPSPQYEREPLLKPTDIQSPLYGAINCVHDPLSNQDDFSSMENSSPPSPLPITNNYICSQSAELNRTTKKPMIGLVREEVVVLLTAQFVTFFNQTALETLVTPLAQTYLGFEDLQNSLLYFLCGIEMLIGFLVVRILSRCCSDRILLVFGLCICNISCVWCLLFLAKPKGTYGFLLAEFVIGVFLQVLGLPFVSVSQVSLFSKLTSEKTQGFNHGLRRSVGGVATILGPLWAAGLTQNLYIMLGTMMGLLLLISVMVIVSYKYLVEPPASEDQSS